MEWKLVFLLVCMFAASSAQLGGAQYLRSGPYDKDFAKMLELVEKRDEIMNMGLEGDSDLDICPDVESRGFVCESHDVTTKDGFILTTQHIFPKDRPAATKGPIFIQHGVIDSAATWIVNNRTRSLPYILSDAGYDVWLGNSRGVVPNRHTEYESNDPRLWEWSFDEMAQYDVPANINYIKQKTGAKKVGYVGHSQGTLIGFIAFQNQDIADSISAMVALAPVTYVDNMSLNFNETFAWLLKKFCDSGSDPRSCSATLWGSARGFLKNACTLLSGVCASTTCKIAGCSSKDNYDQKRFSFLFKHYPMNVAFQDFRHFDQMQKSKKMQKYDYGKEENQKRYGQPTPPQYDLGNMKAKVALFSGKNDLIADVKDVARTVEGLPKEVLVRNVENDFGHGDFPWSLTAADVLYPEILKVFEEFPPTPPKIEEAQSSEVRIL